MKNEKKENILFKLLRPYKKLLIINLVLFLFANALNLAFPALIGKYIDNFTNNGRVLNNLDYILLIILLISVFVSGLMAVYYSNYLSEKIAKNLRQELISKLSTLSYSSLNKIGVGDIITIFSSDVNNTKNVVSGGIVYIFTAILILFGSIILMLMTNWVLALIAMSIFPIIIFSFYYIFKRVTPLFGVSQKILGQINKIVGENIFGAGLIRVLQSQEWEEKKFNKVLHEDKSNNINIINLFSLLIPSINIISNLTIVLILFVGGRLIVDSNLSIGQFTSFIAYFNLLILPIFILGFTSQSIGTGLVSYKRILNILDTKTQENNGIHKAEIKGNIKVKNVSLVYDGKNILNNISFEIKEGTRNAILGPTGAGKSQLLSLITGLNQPTSGKILIDDIDINEWHKQSLLSQVGLVFQDSVIFRGSIKDNIAFSNLVTNESLANAIFTSNLNDFIDNLENGLETVISERGNNLSGGQKQRLMLARSLAISPKILLLDDFTARVDNQTEKEIWHRLKKKYPKITLISITQKIDSVKDFDNIIVLMEGELLGIGSHEYLLETNVDYRAIHNSQLIINNNV